MGTPRGAPTRRRPRDARPPGPDSPGQRFHHRAAGRRGLRLPSRLNRTANTGVTDGSPPPPSGRRPLPHPSRHPSRQHLRPSRGPALPPDAPARTDLLRLAQSLSGSSDALADYAKAYTRNRAVGQAEAGESAALGLRLRTTRNELSAMLTRPGGVPAGVIRRTLEIGHGENLAQDFVQDVRQRYFGQSTAGPNQPSNAFDRNSGDVDAWFKQLTSEREGQLPQAPGVLLGWRRVMTEEQQRLYADQNQHIQERTLQANFDAAHSAFYGIATNEVASGVRDPKAIHEKMQEALPRLQQLHLLTPKQANAALFSSARAIAEQGIPGNPGLAVDIVREMLLGERRGANGQVLAPLGGSAEYAHLTNQTIEAAQKKAGELQRTLETETIVRFREDALSGRLDEPAAKRFFADNPHVLGGGTQGHLEALLLQNRTAVDKAREAQTKIADDLSRRAVSDASEAQLNEFLRTRGDAGTLQGVPERMQVLKPNGERKEIQRAELLDRARDNELARIDEWGRQQAAIEADAQVRGPTSGPSISQRVFDRQFDFLNRNGMEHPGWKDTLSGGYAAATPAAVAGAQLPPLLTQATQLYETLEARAPGMLERHLPSQAARDFYRTYRIGRTGLRMDERQAMVFATTATSDVGADETRAPQFKKIEEELANSQSIFPWTQGVTNFGDMRENITRVSRVPRLGRHARGCRVTPGRRGRSKAVHERQRLHGPHWGPRHRKVRGSLSGRPSAQDF